MNVGKQIELVNQQPSPEEGKVHRLVRKDVQNEIDKIILETAVSNNSFYFYHLSCEGEIRYIGITGRTLQKRLKEHISRSKHYHRRTHKEWWILKCLSDNKEITIHEIFKAPVGYESAKKIEWLLIEDAKLQGYRIVNANRENRNEFTKSESFLDKSHSYVPVVLLDKQGNYVMEFKNSLDCVKHLGCTSGFLSSVLKGRKPSIKGYLAIYKEDYDPEFQYQYINHVGRNSPFKDNEKIPFIRQQHRKATCRCIERISLDGNERIEFECLSDALRSVKQPPNYGSNIISVINGKRNHAYGYKWKYC